MSKANSALRRVLNEDELVSDFFDKLESLTSGVNLARLDAEMKTLFSQRSSRDLYKVALQPTPLYKAISNDLRARSRITEIRVELIRARADLARPLKKLSNYVFVKYADYIADMPSARTQTGKKALERAIFAAAYEFLDEISVTIEAAELYVADIDAAGFGLTNDRAILTLMTERKDQVV